MLEVIAIRPAAGDVMVIAGMGPSADWYRNIQANPAVQIAIGRHRFSPSHRVVDETEAVTVVRDYEHDNRLVLPIIRFLLGKLLGWRYDSSPTAGTRLARQLPIVAFNTRTTQGESR